MFWKKKETAEKTSEPKAIKLPPPKDMPSTVGRYLVVQLKQDPDWVWKLKGVVRPREQKDTYDFRIFNNAQTSAKKISVKDYTSLENHPDLVLYQGWFDKKSGQVNMEEKKPAEALPTEEQNIAEVPLKGEKKTTKA